MITFSNCNWSIKQSCIDNKVRFVLDNRSHKMESSGLSKDEIKEIIKVLKLAKKKLR